MQLDTTVPPIEALPDDNVQRVVWWYGPIFRNDSLAADIPLIAVLFKKIEDGVISEKSEMYKIGVPNLDILRIGSIWHGKHRLKEHWKQYNKTTVVREEYAFNFTEYEAQSILFSTKNNRHWYIPPFKYSLGELSKKGKVYFFNSTMVKLFSENNKTVLVPSMEFMTSTWLPKNQQLRNQIMMNNVDIFLEKNIKEYSKEDTFYKIKIDSNKDASTLKFLAYLACNHTTRNNVSKLWNSLQTTSLDKDGNPYSNRQPIVLPYNPKNLKLTVDGIWIDKETFLVFRISKFSFPSCHQIKVVLPKNNSEDAEKNLPTNQNINTDTEKEITYKKNPSRSNGVMYIKSEVETEDADDIIYIEEEQEQFSSNSYVENINEIEAISSGEMKSGLDSENIAAIKIEPKNENPPEHRPANNIEQHKVLREVKDALENLKYDKDLNIENIYYLNNDANTTLTPSYCYFPMDHPDLEKNKSWLTKNNMNRKALLVKIVLQNKKCAYLLEINRHSNHESFLGVVFQLTERKITKKHIVPLLVKITKIKGAYSSNKNHKRSYAKLPVERKKFYDHKKIKKSMQKKIKHVLLNVAKDIFI